MSGLTSAASTMTSFIHPLIIALATGIAYRSHQTMDVLESKEIRIPISQVQANIIHNINKKNQEQIDEVFAYFCHSIDATKTYKGSLGWLKRRYWREEERYLDYD
jgi:hypothetical protein